MKLKRGKALTSTEMETVPLSGDALSFFREATHVYLTLCQMYGDVLLRIRTSESKTFLFGLFYLFFRFAFLQFFFLLSPFPCFPLFLFSTSFLFLPFCLVSLHLVSFCLPPVLLYSVLVFHLLTNMTFFPSFLHFFFTYTSSCPFLYIVFFILLSLLLLSVVLPSLALHFIFSCFLFTPFLYLVL